MVGKQILSRSSIRKNIAIEHHPDHLTTLMSPIMSPTFKDEKEKEKTNLKKAIMVFDETNPNLEDFPKIKEEYLHLKQYSKIQTQEIDLLNKRPLNLEPIKSNIHLTSPLESEKDSFKEWDFENLKLDFNLEEFLINHIKVPLDKNREEFLIKERLKCIKQTIINNSEDTITIIHYHSEGTKSNFTLYMK